MGSFKLDKFGGMLPAWDPHLLPPGQAQIAENTYLFSGALSGWRTPKTLRNLLNSSARMVYRVPTITKQVARDVLTLLAAPAEGDTVKVGEEVYKFTATVKQAYDVLIGVDAGSSALNLFRALTVDNGTSTGAGTVYGVATVANPWIDQSGAARTPVDSLPNTISGAVITLYAPDSGAAYNTTMVAESTGGSRMSWASATFTGGADKSFDPTITGAATWLEFLDQNTDVMRSPVVDDKFDRYYFASPSLPPQYNTYDRIVAGQPPFMLGVPAPGCAPGVVVTGGGNLGTIGKNTSTSTNTYNPLANTMLLVPVTPTGAVQLNDVTFMPASTTTTDFSAVLYDNSGANGGPGTLLNVGQIVNGTTVAVAATSVFTNPTGLLANVTYWMGVIIDGPVSIQLADDKGAAGNLSTLATFSNGPPAIAPASFTTFTQNLQLWGNVFTASVLEARSYVYTWVTAYGEESPPSPATIETGWSNGTWTVSLFTPPPDEMGVTRNITTVRLYRTVPATGGQTSFFFVKDLQVGTISYVDTATDDKVAINTLLQSTLWFPPPESLEAMISLPNGIAVGFKGNEIWFSEAYRPHAWPPSYVLTTEFPIIGIGAHLNAVIVATAGKPYVASGVSPASMSLTKIEQAEPCLSRRSVVSTTSGVYYMSPNGLIQVMQTGQASNFTAAWVTREKWRQRVPQKNVCAIPLVDSYFAYGTVVGADNSVAQKGFTVEIGGGDNESFSIWPQPGGHRIGMSTLTAPNALDIANVQVDPWTGTGLLIQNGKVLYYDFSDANYLPMPYTWRSHVYTETAKQNFEAMRIQFKAPPGLPAQNATRNIAATTDASWGALLTGQYGIVRVYADGVLVTTREIRFNNELLRVLSGFKATEWEVEITAVVDISKIKVATSAKGLREL